MSTHVNSDETQALRTMIDKCENCGLSLQEFIQDIRKMGIKNPLPFLKGLKDQGFLQVDAPDERRTKALIKPLPPAYEVLGLKSSISTT